MCVCTCTLTLYSVALLNVFISSNKCVLFFFVESLGHLIYTVECHRDGFISSFPNCILFIYFALLHELGLLVLFSIRMTSKDI